MFMNEDYVLDSCPYIQAALLYAHRPRITWPADMVLGRHDMELATDFGAENQEPFREAKLSQPSCYHSGVTIRPAVFLPLNI